MLTTKQLAFADHVAVHRDRIAAYRHAYNAEKMGGMAVNIESYRLMRHPQIAQRVQDIQNEALRQADSVWSVREIVQFWSLQMGGDPRRIVTIKRDNCRCCWGEGFKHQWTEDEYFVRCDLATKAKEPLPEIAGGFGWVERRPPNEDCPVCAGVGFPRCELADFDTLLPQDAAIIQSVKQTRNGFEVTFYDKTKIGENLMRAQGGFNDKLTLAGEVTVNAPAIEDLSPHEAARAYQEFVAANAA